MAMIGHTLPCPLPCCGARYSMTAAICVGCGLAWPASGRTHSKHMMRASCGESVYIVRSWSIHPGRCKCRCLLHKGPHGPRELTSWILFASPSSLLFIVVCLVPLTSRRDAHPIPGDCPHHRSRPRNRGQPGGPAAKQNLLVVEEARGPCYTQAPRAPCPSVGTPVDQEGQGLLSRRPAHAYWAEAEKPGRRA